ncbi:MAG: NAD(P)/FAD-dependent oxidoreductase [Flavobacteriaceae bacterium]
MVDYLVVGLGLAGISFCEVLEENDRTYRVVNNNSQISSSVAAGLYNPVVLKRFTLAWKAKEQLNLVAPFYEKLEVKLNTKLHDKLKVFRRFASPEEQNNWYQAMDTVQLGDLLSPVLQKNSNPSIDAPHGFGEVLNTGRVATAKMVDLYSSYLLEEEKLLQETFDFKHFRIKEDGIEYKSIRAKHLVFAEGFGLKQNPYFNYLPLVGTKGELLVIKAPELKLNHVIKSSVFLIPEGNDRYRVGATYKWKDKTNTPTEEARKELIEKLRSFLRCDFEVEEHLAGIRPTVTDRRPLLGQHPEYKRLFVYNGLGSRGVMIAPYTCRQLFDLIEEGKSVHPDIDIRRFDMKYA